jgi:hypothetical protein
LFIPDPDADFLPARIQGSKRHPIPDPQHWFLSAISSTDVQGVSLASLEVWMCRVSVFIKAGLSSIRSVQYLTEQNVPVRYWDNGNQFDTGMFRYRTEIQDAGMPMPSYGR